MCPLAGERRQLFIGKDGGGMEREVLVSNGGRDRARNITRGVTKRL